MVTQKCQMSTSLFNFGGVMIEIYYGSHIAVTTEWFEL